MASAFILSEIGSVWIKLPSIEGLGIASIALGSHLPGRIITSIRARKVNRERYKIGFAVMGFVESIAFIGLVELFEFIGLVGFVGFMELFELLGSIGLTQMGVQPGVPHCMDEPLNMTVLPCSCHH